ncbi:MAG: protein kinase, partial [Gemmataceae bacterium]
MARVYRQDLEIVPGFRLLKPLGRGGFGEVWKASAPGGAMSAIKIISLGERSGFKELRAVQLVKQVRHPNLVPINAFWLLNREGEIVNQIRDESMARRAQELDLIMAMGLGDMNLLDRLRQCQEEGRGGIPVEELLNYMEDAARAIDFLNQPIHQLEEGKGGIQHCDIKPQNILIVGGAAQVCDFGLARVLGDSRITSAKGSAAYMSPEMISDNKPSPRSDQYSLAISYVELRTGRLPVNMSSPAAAIYAHVQGQLDLTRLRPQENVVIKRATEVDPEKRFPTTIEMVRALRAACMPGTGGSVIIAPVGLKPEDHLNDGMEVVPGYKLLRKIGQGGYGQVWEAAAPGGKHVALKIIRNLEGSQGQQEFRALELIKQVDHNHLMELHAYWLIDRQGTLIPDELRDKPDAPRASTLVIASKLATKNLLQRLHECEEEGRAGIPPGELLDYMRESAEAIDYLNAPVHELGDRKVSIQHRDIKPENILIASGVVKVGDFGLAKVVEGTSALIHGDSAGLTLAYAAPEMFANRVTSWSDQYCLALTYFKLRTGEFPFPPGCRPSDVIKRHVNGKLDLRRLAEGERSVIAKATD